MHSIEGEAVANYIDQFPPSQRSALVSLLFSYGSVMQSQSNQPPSPCVKIDHENDLHPGEGGATCQSPLTEAEQDILDFLARVPITNEGHPVAFKGNEIADGVGRAYNYIKSLLTKDAPLRRRGLIDHRRNVGYWLVKPRAQFTLQNDPLCDVDQAILDLLDRVDAPMVGPDIAAAINTRLPT